jgi:hypothetical protein
MEMQKGCAADMLPETRPDEKNAEKFAGSGKNKMPAN